MLYDNISNQEIIQRFSLIFSNTHIFLQKLRLNTFYLDELLVT